MLKRCRLCVWKSVCAVLVLAGLGSADGGREGELELDADITYSWGVSLLSSPLSPPSF